METTVMGHKRTTIRICSFIPSKAEGSIKKKCVTSRVPASMTSTLTVAGKTSLYVVRG